MTALRNLAGASALSVMVALGGPAAMAGGSIKDAAQPFSWSGFSVGVHTGYGFEGAGDQRASTDGLGFIGTDVNSVDLEGVFAGASLARDWQTGNVVFGIVVDISKSDFSGFSQVLGATLNGFETKIDWFGTVRGKLGYATGPYLLYATGGLAYGRATQGALIPPGVFDPVEGGVVSGKETRVGWAAGVGSNLIPRC